ncbi:unnamed protein product [Onchocerca ochengi]|uniref:PHD-type domain-containing protein n=1 Tax=Onchocerca ochengi TaxID=42157 RepID=A0A182EIB9_ONCOC|nr:unnamed protein product [Onchocerca ochengi]
MRNGAVKIRGRLRKRCTTSSLNDNQFSPSEEEVPTIKKEANKADIPQRSLYVYRNEVTGDLDNFSEDYCFSTDFAEDREDSDDEQYLKSKRKFYIVAEGGNAPELYRTDLIQKMKQEEYSDTSSDDETAFVSMSDHWKEEWNRGVQVPLSKNLPDFIVDHSPCSSFDISRTQSQVSSKRNASLISVHDRRYIGNKHKHIIMPKLRNYQTDQLDCIFLCKLNEKRISGGLPPISEKTFGEVIDKLEISCYQAMHSDLLSSITSIASADAEFDENVCCDICRQPDYEEDDKIIFCDGCNVSVHQSCYGLDSVPSDEWLCQKCIVLDCNTIPKCVLCPLTGGAMKCTKDGNTWAHVVCALWIYEVRFEDVVHREPIANISDIPYGRWMLRCSVCGTKLGACIQCSVETCTTAFHVCCALRSGQIMRIERDSDNDNDVDNNNDDDNVRMVSLCREHSLEKMFHSKLRFCNLDVLCATTLKLEEMERIFFLYVTVEDIAGILSLSEDVVSDIYEYWKLRRIDNGYKALLSDKSEIERQIALRLRSSPICVLSGSQRNETMIRQNLEKARNLCYMVEKREKTKLCALQYWIDTYKCVYQMLTEKNVPYSKRVLKRFIHAMSSMQQTSSNANDADSSENFLVLSPSKSYSSPRSPSPPRKQLSVDNRIREKNGLSHHLRKYAMQKVLFAADKFIKNSQESFISGHYSSLRA